MQYNGDDGHPRSQEDKLKSQNKHNAFEKEFSQNEDSSFFESINSMQSLEYDEKTLSLSNRSYFLNSILQKLKNQMSENYLENFRYLKIICSKAFTEEQFDVKCFQADQFLLMLDQLKYYQRDALDEKQRVIAYQISQELYQEVHQRKQGIFKYDSNSNCDLQNDQKEQNLIDIMIASEIISFNIQSIVPNRDNQQEELTDSVQQLITNMNNLTICPEFLEQNKIISKFVTQRGNGGFICSIKEILVQVIENHRTISQNKQMQQIFQIIENILARVVSLPVSNYNHMINCVIISLVNNTDQQYHIQLIDSLFTIYEAIFDEKRRGKQESFKQKVLLRISQLLTLILYKTGDQGKVHIFKKIEQIYSTNCKNELLYLYFQVIQGNLMRVKNTEKFGFQKAVSKIIIILLEKLEAHIKDNKEQIEKTASIKTLVLLFKPLEECLNILGPLNSLLPDGYRKKVHGILNQLRKLFPVDKPPECQVPFSLLESYFNLQILLDTDFQKTNQMHFQNFYKLFVIVENQLDKNEQNALIMSKLVILQTKTSVPDSDKNHFYSQFGKSVQKILLIKDFNVFYHVLQAFIEWATNTELQDLNFMLPNDQKVQNILQTIMQSNNLEKLVPQMDINQKTIDVNESYSIQSMKDYEIIKKFCKTQSQIVNVRQEFENNDDNDLIKIDLTVCSQNQEENQKNKQQPQLNSLSDQDQKFLKIGQKLIEVELEMRKEEEDDESCIQFTPEQIQGISLKMYNLYKKQQQNQNLNIKDFKEFMSKNKNMY